MNKSKVLFEPDSKGSLKTHRKVKIRGRKWYTLKEGFDVVPFFFLFFLANLYVDCVVFYIKLKSV
ncbi:hypothetical protein TanjilG_29578 [Lupinus angustifolius]|uniref:Uncharacterized protein n=1 Tax=Lupinus angustifolius TaxID=3871 RepID=A0A4P1R5Q4_LUPAN|nr:hypothetical protein TanjilG_29578 [Lupinus angustifolius]